MWFRSSFLSAEVCSQHDQCITAHGVFLDFGWQDVKTCWLTRKHWVCKCFGSYCLFPYRRHCWNANSQNHFWIDSSLKVTLFSVVMSNVCSCMILEKEILLYFAEHWLWRLSGFWQGDWQVWNMWRGQHCLQGCVWSFQTHANKSWLPQDSGNSWRSY